MEKFENFRFRLEGPLKAKWFSLCRRKHISQQDAINALLAWFIEQDSLLQSMIFGQIESGDWPSIAQVVLERFAAVPRSASAGVRLRNAAKKDPDRQR